MKIIHKKLFSFDIIRGNYGVLSKLSRLRFATYR